MLLDFRPDGICVICVICETFLYICDNLRICVICVKPFFKIICVRQFNPRETYPQNKLSIG